MNPTFEEFIKKKHKILQESKNTTSKKEEILARTVKLNEEIGELCNEVLAYNNDQRKGKMVNHDKDTLGLEFADVIITTYLLAESFGINIETNLFKKIKIIQEKHNKEL